MTLHANKMNNKLVELHQKVVVCLKYTTCKREFVALLLQTPPSTSKRVVMGRCRQYSYRQEDWRRCRLWSRNHRPARSIECSSCQQLPASQAPMEWGFHQRSSPYCRWST